MDKDTIIRKGLIEHMLKSVSFISLIESNDEIHELHDKCEITYDDIYRVLGELEETLKS